jgi:hypothetical protein
MTFNEEMALFCKGEYKQLSVSFMAAYDFLDRELKEAIAKELQKFLKFGKTVTDGGRQLFETTCLNIDLYHFQILITNHCISAIYDRYRRNYIIPSKAHYISKRDFEWLAENIIVHGGPND